MTCTVHGEVGLVGGAVRECSGGGDGVAGRRPQDGKSDLKDPHQ